MHHRQQGSPCIGSPRWTRIIDATNRGSPLWGWNWCRFMKTMMKMQASPSQPLFSRIWVYAWAWLPWASSGSRLMLWVIPRGISQLFRCCTRAPRAGWNSSMWPASVIVSALARSCISFFHRDWSVLSANTSTPPEMPFFARRLKIDCLRWV